MKVQLELTHKKAKVKNVLLKADTVIGRSTDCGLRIASNEVSRQHCKICLSEDSVTVRDLGSSNGTFVNGYQLEPDTDYEIAPDSELALGGIKFIVRFSEPAEKAMRTDGLGSTVDLKPELDAETADFGQETLRDEPVEEDVSFAEADETPSERPEGESAEETDSTEVARPPELEDAAEEADFEMSTHGDSAILQHEEPTATEADVEPESEEAVEDASAEAEEPETKAVKVVVDLDLEESEAESGEEADEAEDVELELDESAKAEVVDETKPPMAKPVEPQSTPEKAAEEGGEEMGEDDVAAFLNQVSEEDAGDDEDESLGDFFKQFD